MISGEDVQLPKESFAEIFRLAGLGKDDVFYHLGCGDETGVRIAVEDFSARRAVGIDNNEEKIQSARDRIKGSRIPAELLCKDVEDADIGDATVILFWFADEDVIEKMMAKFEGLGEGTRIITVWGPLPRCLPEKSSFPYIVNTIPLKKGTVQEQLRAVFGVECVDFVTAWEHAERYTRAVGAGVKNDRFLTIIQTLIIWLNARRLGVACGEEVPESIRTYINIMKMHFDIDFEHMLEPV